MSGDDSRGGGVDDGKFGDLEEGNLNNVLWRASDERGEGDE